MTRSTSGWVNAAQHRKTSRVRLLGDVLDGETQGRREFLRMMAARGASIPATYFMIGDGFGGRPIPGAPAALVQSSPQHKGTMRHKADSDSLQIAREFLHTMTLQGLPLPAVYFMLGNDFSDQTVLEARAAGKTGPYPSSIGRETREVVQADLRALVSKRAMPREDVDSTPIVTDAVGGTE